MAGSPLLRLPAEILRLICGEFCQHCRADSDSMTALITTWREKRSRARGRSALVNLCLTTSAVCQIAQPFLYHRISLEEVQIPSLISAVATIARRQELAQAAVQLVVGEIYDDEEEIGSADASLLTRESRLLGISFPENWEDNKHLEFTSGLEPRLDLLQQLLLVKLPNVENIVLSSLSYHPWKALGSLKARAYALRMLRCISLQYYDVEGGFDFANMATLFRLSPSLSTLAVSRCRAFSRKTPIKATRFSLMNSCLSHQDMERALSCCPNLSAFGYSTRATGVGEGVQEVTPKEVVSLLKMLGHDKTLQDLYLDFPDSTVRWDKIDTLESFSRLHRLYLGSEIANHGGENTDGANSVLFPNLPSTVHHIHISDQPAFALNAIHGLRDKISEGAFPNLKVLSFAPKPLGIPGVTEEDTEFPEVKDRLERLGISVTQGVTNSVWWE
jgi:hypothetical protein